MTNLLIQILTLVSGLLVNFLVPGIYGLSAYGEFVKLNVLVFVFQKFFDIVNEQLLAQLEPRYIFFASLMMGAAVWALFAGVDLALPLGSLPLLAAMLWSSACLLALFALRLQRWIVCYLIYFLAIFVVTLSLVHASVIHLDVVGVLLFTNLAGAFFATVILLKSGATVPPALIFADVACSTVRALPKMISVTLVFNVLTNILPFLLSRSLGAADLGLFRVMTSIVQSAFSLFPINIRAIFVSFIDSTDRLARFRVFLGLSMIYFASVGIFAEVMSSLVPMLNPYLALLPSLPVLFAAALSERYLIASGQAPKVMIVNVSTVLVGILGWALVENSNTPSALIYACGFSVYLLLLHFTGKTGVSRVGVVYVAVGAPASIYFGYRFPGLSAGYLMTLILCAVLLFRLRWTDIKGMRLTK